jgi:hypothetical protein
MRTFVHSFVRTEIFAREIIAFLAGLQVGCRINQLIFKWYLAFEISEIRFAWSSKLPWMLIFRRTSFFLYFLIFRLPPSKSRKQTLFVWHRGLVCEELSIYSTVVVEIFVTLRSLGFGDVRRRDKIWNKLFELEIHLKPWERVYNI